MGTALTTGTAAWAAAIPERPAARGWSLYVLLAIALAPVVVPTGPAQSAILDLVNFAAIPLFAARVLVRRQAIRIPFAGAALLVVLGSLLATLTATSVEYATLALAQDAYLFVWFVLLVNVLRERQDLTAVRRAWVWVGNGIALYGILQVAGRGLSLGELLRPTGLRATSTFYDPNMCADYLVLSLFVLLGLGQEAGRVFRLGSATLLVLGILATKSNGGLTSLAIGLAVWVIVRAWTLRLSVPALIAIGLFGGTFALGGLWLVGGLGIGAGSIGALGSRSILARAGHSSEARMRIWVRLLQDYGRRPVGIGPGNSRSSLTSVEGRERAGSLESKEAHSDYLGYLVERGPLALLGLLVMKVQAFGRVGSWWRDRLRRGRRSGGALVAATIAALAASSVHSLTLEMLHFRHVWLFLALVCAMDGMTFRPRGRDEAAEAPPPPDQGVPQWAT